jgi:hypothetical protein
MVEVPCGETPGIPSRTIFTFCAWPAHPRLRSGPAPAHVRQLERRSSNWRAHPTHKGSRIREVLSLDREKDYRDARPKRVDCCGSLCAGNEIEMFSTPEC